MTPTRIPPEGIDVERAVEIARDVREEPHAPVGVSANDHGYVVDFLGDDPYAHLVVSANLSVYVDKHTGEAHILGVSEYMRLMPTLRPV